jgi:hypothetical protein
LIGQPNNARRYGLLSLNFARELPPFFRGYSYETLARAEMIADKRVIMNVYLEKAHQLLEQIDDEDNRKMLEQELETVL